MIKGQINLSSSMGKRIYSLVKQNDINNIIEVGTWNGGGSTQCIIQSIKDSNKKNYNVLTFETNINMYKKALSNNTNRLPNFEFVYGRLIELEDLSWFDEKDLDDDHKKWLKEDMHNYQNTNNMIHKIPEKIDLLVLDGGEFSSYPEFHLLCDRSKHIILDDTNVFKFSKVREQIIQNPDKFEIVVDDLDDRNGWMYVIRR